VFKKKVILNIGAWLMLFAFVVNIVPKRYIHDRIASHQHHSSSKEDATKAHFTSKACECEKYFTETAFAKDAISYKITTTSTSITPDFKITTPSYSTVEYIDLRGPPSI
jgi:hypothetical protein